MYFLRFFRFGPITLIRILPPPSFCAFVNYVNKESAAKAMQSLQVRLTLNNGLQTLVGVNDLRQ